MSVRLRCEKTGIAVLDVPFWNNKHLPPDCEDPTKDQYIIDHPFKSPQNQAVPVLKTKTSRKRFRPKWEDEELISTLSKALQSIKKRPELRDFLKEEIKVEDEIGDVVRNESAFKAAKTLERLDDLNLTATCYNLAVFNRNEVTSIQGFHAPISNSSETEWQTFICQEERFLIPPRSSFLMSDLRVSRTLLLNAYKEKKFDLLVMDPPWVNKSVKRQKRYHCIENSDLLQLPVRSLVYPSGLVAIWCTNSEKHQHYLEDTLLPAWNLRQVAKWFWLKVTRSGLPVLPLDFAQRRSFEVLYLAATSDFNSAVPEDLVVVSVPSSVHSRKPPLFELLQPHLQLSGSREVPNCLELFARELREGWHSWGNEPLRFQHYSCFRQLSEAQFQILELEK